MPNTPNLNLPYPAAGQVPNVPADLQLLAQAADAIGDPWASYTPALGSGWSLGNGTVVGYYKAIGKTIIGGIFLRIGSTTLLSTTSLGMTLPITRRNSLPELVGTAYLNDASVSTAAGTAFGQAVIGQDAGSTFQIYQMSGDIIRPTAPWTWATGDRIMVRFEYERV